MTTGSGPGSPTSINIPGAPHLAFENVDSTNSGCPILGAFLSLRQGWEATTLNCPLSTQHKLSVPHPWRVFVFAPRVGSHNPQLPALNSAQTLGAPSLARFCLCAKGGKPQPSTARSQLSTNSGAPSLARFCLCAKGGKPQPSTARSQLSTNSRCPILGAFLSLRQGWEATTPNCPLSTQHKLWLPHPWRVFVSAPRVGSHNTQLPALNSAQTLVPHPWRVFVSAPRVGSHNTQLQVPPAGAPGPSPLGTGDNLTIRGPVLGLLVHAVALVQLVGKPQHLTARSQFNTNSGCPILGAFLSLRQGWEATTLNCRCPRQVPPVPRLWGPGITLRSEVQC